MIDVQSFTGQAARQYVAALARLRITVFREFPYLYVGDDASEQAYLTTFLDAPDSVLVLAFDGSAVIGASTGLPMIHETPNVQAPFRESGYDLARIFYFGESVLLPAYRGQGIGVRFFQHREAHARQYDWACFCAVVRPDDHPRRPSDYQPLDLFWKNRGFRPTEMTCEMEWQDLDEATERPKTLKFWMKSLIDI
jgi:GNAT superfamily N-acetyltransferase